MLSFQIQQRKLDFCTVLSQIALHEVKRVLSDAEPNALKLDPAEVTAAIMQPVAPIEQGSQILLSEIIIKCKRCWYISLQRCIWLMGKSKESCLGISVVKELMDDKVISIQEVFDSRVVPNLIRLLSPTNPDATTVSGRRTLCHTIERRGVIPQLRLLLQHLNISRSTIRNTCEVLVCLASSSTDH